METSLLWWDEPPAHNPCGHDEKSVNPLCAPRRRLFAELRGASCGDTLSRVAMLFWAHKPVSSLARFVDHLWCLNDAPAHQLERVLPAGTLELVINLDQDAFRIHDRERPSQYQRIAGAIVSGAYSRYFVIDTREHASIIGVHFKPGGALPFFPVPSGALADRHVELEQLWGVSARALREQLCEERGPQRRFQLLEQALLARLAGNRAPRPAACAGLEWLSAGRKVTEVASALGLSRRRLITVFTEDVGVTPKVFARIMRFQRALARAQSPDASDWSQIALQMGYFDQSHMIRDFVDFAGLTPAALRVDGSATHVKTAHIAIAQGSHLSNTPVRSSLRVG
jgi:AraC-like DNA-binding protein